MPDILTLPRWKRPGSFGVRHERQDVPVATEEELLDFANRWRAAGSAEALPALVPSDPVNTESCLIANALNFDCAVDAAGYGDLWEITITGESPLTPEQIAAISIAGSFPNTSATPPMPLIEAFASSTLHRSLMPAILVSYA
jgi:hypothetical protein